MAKTSTSRTNGHYEMTHDRPQTRSGSMSQLGQSRRFDRLQSGGQNLLRGLENLLVDLERGNGRLSITMTDLKAFRLSENIATTPGKIVYQNELMQLIQYRPRVAGLAAHRSSSGCTLKALDRVDTRWAE